MMDQKDLERQANVGAVIGLAGIVAIIVAVVLSPLMPWAKFLIIGVILAVLGFVTVAAAS